MALNADTLLDRLYLKSQITRWRALAIIFGVLALLAVFGKVAPHHSPIEGDYIARLNIDGIIGDDQRLYDLIDDIGSNPRIKAVELWLDTPGGSAVGGEETFLRLRVLARQKPVVAVMRSVSASAGYMIALGADQIFAREATITGSIGVIIESAEITELANKIGIKPVVIKSSALKGTPSFVEKTTPEAERVVHEMLMDFYDRFVDMVAERRKLPREEVVKLADGRIYSGRAAVANKLIDGIGGENEAIQWMLKEKKIKTILPVRDVSLKEENSLFDEFTQSLAGKFFQNSRIGLDGMSAIWHPQLH